MTVAPTNESAANANAPPIAIRRIMVPLDLSQHSHKAIQYAIRFAQQFGAEIELVHVITPLGYEGLVIPTALQQVELELRKHARQELEKLVGKNEQYNFPLKSRVLLGDPAKEVADLAREHQTDLILVTTIGRSGLRHLLLGSTAERIVRHAPCPVFVVREKEHEFITEEQVAAGPAVVA